MHKKETKFLNAAKLNKFDSIRKIFEKVDKAKNKRKSKENFDIDSKDSNGTTALHHAAKNGNVDLMTFLVSRGADIESIDQIGWRPISYACANNHFDAVKTLIQWKSNVNKFSLMEENSPLHIAASFGYLEIVKLLMENGANVHNQNKKHQTPMDVACENNQYKIVNVLLSASSKLIEDNTNIQNCSINNYVPALNSSLSRSSLFIKSQSINNNANHIISRMKSGNQNNNDFEFKRRTIGSQSQLCTPMELPIPKKSGSLNTVFLNDQEGKFENPDQSVEKSQVPRDTGSKSNPSEIEVNLPYPTRFNTSDKLRIKSPLLATKNLRLNERMKRNNPSLTEISYPKYSAQIVFPLETHKSPSIDHIPQDIKKKNVRPLSLSQKETVSKQFSMNCINSPSIIATFIPTYYVATNNSADFESQSNLQFSKFQSIKREFGSESDIKESQYKKESIQTKPFIMKKPVVIQSQTKPLLFSNCVTQKNEIQFTNEKKFENHEKFTCRQWIKSLGLERIWDTLLKEGFDSFLALSLARDEELLLLCDNNIYDWGNLKQNLDSLKIPPIDHLEFSPQVLDVLLQLGLECYADNFYANGYHTIEHISEFQEINLNKLQIYKIGHRKLILSCFNVLRNNLCPPNKDTNSFIFIRESPVSNYKDDVKVSVSNNNAQVLRENEKSNMQQKVYPNNLLRPLVSYNCPTMPKKSPPPVPSRSSSILDVPELEDITLHEIQPAVDFTKMLSSEKTEPNTSSLDDIVDLLQNLGKELDIELNKI